MLRGNPRQRRVRKSRTKPPSKHGPQSSSVAPAPTTLPSQTKQLGPPPLTHSNLPPQQHYHGGKKTAAAATTTTTTTARFLHSTDGVMKKCERIGSTTGGGVQPTLAVAQSSVTQDPSNHQDFVPWFIHRPIDEAPTRPTWDLMQECSTRQETVHLLPPLVSDFDSAGGAAAASSHRSPTDWLIPAKEGTPTPLARWHALADPNWPKDAAPKEPRLWAWCDSEGFTSTHITGTPSQSASASDHASGRRQVGQEPPSRGFPFAAPTRPAHRHESLSALDRPDRRQLELDKFFLDLNPFSAAPVIQSQATQVQRQSPNNPEQDRIALGNGVSQDLCIARPTAHNQSSRRLDSAFSLERMDKSFYTSNDSNADLKRIRSSDPAFCPLGPSGHGEAPVRLSRGSHDSGMNVRANADHEQVRNGAAFQRSHSWGNVMKGMIGNDRPHRSQKMPPLTPTRYTPPPQVAPSSNESFLGPPTRPAFESGRHVQQQQPVDIHNGDTWQFDPHNQSRRIWGVRSAPVADPNVFFPDTSRQVRHVTAPPAPTGQLDVDPFSPASAHSQSHGHIQSRESMLITRVSSDPNITLGHTHHPAQAMHPRPQSQTQTRGVGQPATHHPFASDLKQGATVQGKEPTILHLINQGTQQQQASGGPGATQKRGVYAQTSHRAWTVRSDPGLAERPNVGFTSGNAQDPRTFQLATAGQAFSNGQAGDVFQQGLPFGGKSQTSFQQPSTDVSAISFPSITPVAAIQPPTHAHFPHAPLPVSAPPPPAPQPPSQHHHHSHHFHRKVDYDALPLESFVGHVVSISKDQHGCRFLQKKIEECSRSKMSGVENGRGDGSNGMANGLLPHTPQSAQQSQQLTGDPRFLDVIFREALPKFGELMVDPFGNYLCQKLVEHCTDAQLTAIMDAVSPDLVTISLNMHGTRAVQKMTEYLTLPSQIAILIRALSPHVVTLIKDLNGNHVIQRCLNKLQGKDCQFIYDAVGRNCVEIATHRHGCCVFQRCVDFAKNGQREQVVREVTNTALTLVQDPFGNYVVQYILDLNDAVFADTLSRMFLGNVQMLSIQKFSSNVIEKCIRVASPQLRRLFVAELLASPRLEQLLRDSYANYVIQTSLDYADPIQRTQLIDLIKPILPQIRNTPYGKRIQAKIQRIEGLRALETSFITTVDGGFTTGATANAISAHVEEMPSGRHHRAHSHHRLPHHGSAPSLPQLPQGYATVRHHHRLSTSDARLATRMNKMSLRDAPSTTSCFPGHLTAESNIFGTTPADLVTSVRLDNAPTQQAGFLFAAPSTEPWATPSATRSDTGLPSALAT